MCVVTPSPSVTASGDAPAVSDAVPPTVGGVATEISPGVYVIPDGRTPLVPNVGIVVGERAALVVDTGLGPRSGAYVLNQARELGGGRPLYLTTTHFHPEHASGAQAFKGEATIVCNTAQRDEMRTKGQAHLDMLRAAGPVYAEELQDVTFVDPDIVYVGSAAIDLGGVRVCLRSVGPAHSTGDQIVAVADRVLFTGDLLEHKMFPLAPFISPTDVDCDVMRWTGLLDELVSVGTEITVPGHGEITPETLASYRDYFQFLRAEATRSWAAGISVDQAAETIKKAAQSRWTDWDHTARISSVVGAFYRAAEAA
ncbi:MBL fold metallo-hydrolase [Mycolicibacterium litorale]|nr:MBL fold metallo-hydrolase [Mycolicibacterium litorale]